MKTSFEKFMASNAVNPVELGEHKVELALIDDIRNSIKTAFALYDVQSPLISAQMQVKKAKNEYTVALAKAEDGLKKAKELGSEMMMQPFQKSIVEIKGGISLCDKLILAIDKAISAV